MAAEAPAGGIGRDLLCSASTLAMCSSFAAVTDCSAAAASGAATSGAGGATAAIGSAAIGSAAIGSTFGSTAVEHDNNLKFMVAAKEREMTDKVEFIRSTIEDEARCSMKVKLENIKRECELSVQQEAEKWKKVRLKDFI